MLDPKELEALERDAVAAIGEWIGFSASVIKSGEPWTSTCEDRYQKARQGLALCKRQAAEVEALQAQLSVVEGDALRYRRLRVLGCAVMDTPQLDAGTVVRFTGLDAIVDADLRFRRSRGEARATLESTAPTEEEGKAIPMLLFCPKCGVQHVDAPSEGWTNPPHRSHLCHACGTIWRPADVPTEGVASISTAGKADNWTVNDRPALPVQDVAGKLAQLIASWPAHPDDQGPDNEVIGDRLTFDPGQQIGEWPATIDRLAARILASLSTHPQGNEP